MAQGTTISSGETVPSIVITLSVGGQHFKTTKETLEGSNYFRALFENKPPSNGNICRDIDVDPSVFSYVLRFLRDGALPLFYDRSRGHDYGQYEAILNQARNFEVDGLVSYLANKRYLSAVKIQHTIERIEEVNGYFAEHHQRETVGSDVEIEYHVTSDKKKVYVCPRGILGHRGRPMACGRQCHNVQGEAPAEYEEEGVLKILKIKKRVIVEEPSNVGSGD